MKKNGNHRMHNAKGKETLAALMYDKDPNQLYLQMHNMNNPMPICSNLSEFLGNNPNVVYPLRIVPPNFNGSAQSNATITSSTFLNNRTERIAPNTYKRGKVRNNKGNAPSPRLKDF